MRMLYVEDDRLNALLFEEVMRLRGGVDLRVAQDAAQAMEALEDWRPDILVLDAQLPDMNGFDVLAALRERPGMHAVPALMCSADTSEEQRDRSRMAGFSGFWTKPLNVSQVMADLDRLALAPGTP